MKGKITLLALGTLAGTMLLINSNNLVANGGGAPGGNSSSGGDSGNSCGQGGCHGGGHTVSSSALIVTDIPGSGYIPGNTYNVTVTGVDGGYSKFGFELAAEDGSNNTAGTLAASLSGREQLRGNGHLTHTISGTTGASGNFGWNGTWVAPTAGTGTVTFSTSVLFADGNGGNSGDSTVVSSITVSEDLTASISDISQIKANVFPNPVVEELNIKVDVTDYVFYQLFNANGKLVKKFQSNTELTTISLSELKSGTYFLHAHSSEASFVKLIQKK